MTFAISGMIWIAEAPVPITATRLPARSASWSQRAEWNTSPWKESMPSMSGSRGSTRRAGAGDQGARTYLPLLVVVTQRWASSSHRASSTSVPNRNRSRTPDSRATRCR